MLPRIAKLMPPLTPPLPLAIPNPLYLLLNLQPDALPSSFRRSDVPSFSPSQIHRDAFANPFRFHLIVCQSQFQHPTSPLPRNSPLSTEFNLPRSSTCRRELQVAKSDSYAQTTAFHLPHVPVVPHHLPNPAR